MGSIYNGFGKYVRLLAVILIIALAAHRVDAQNKQYQQPKKNVVNPSKSKAKTGKDEYKVDLSDIEKKYWAPKDTDFSVVQSRTYTKEKRFSLSLQTGPVISDIYNKGFNYSLTLNYFLDDRHGFGFNLIEPSWQNTDAIDAFRNDVGGGKAGAEPDRGRLERYYGISYSWVPIYAKMSFLGQKILYFDMAITPTLGIANYNKLSEVGDQSASSLAYGIDVTQYYFVNKHWAVRADLKNIWYKEDRVTYKSGVPITDQVNNTSIFLLGVTYYH